jgi:hypothetical protein
VRISDDMDRKANHDRAELDYEAVVAALEGFVGDYVSVRVEDPEGAVATIAALDGVLGSGTPQETPRAGVEGVWFTVGEIPRSYRRGPSGFGVWRAAFQTGLAHSQGMAFRMGPVVVVVDHVPA